MRQLYCHALLLALVCLFMTGCIVHVRPIPVMEIHPLEIELYH